MKQRTFAGLAAGLIAAGLIGSAPPAGAGCMYGGYGARGRCDDPVQPDATWQRCMDYDDSVTSPAPWHRHRCFVMGPGQNPPLGLILNLFPDNIDEGPGNPS